MGKMDGLVCVVTGAARGIGAAITRLFTQEGASVIICDLLDEEGEALATELGHTARFIHLDVTNEAGWQSMIVQAHRAYGPVSVLVNNAGIVEFGRIEHQSPESFRRVWDVNLQGAWLGIRSVIPSMREVGSGVIVNMSSAAGMIGYSDLGAYVASKWALRGLTKTAALELASDHIRVCSVHPGPIRTPMTAGMGEAMAAWQPIPRFGTPEEVASMTLFIASEATYSTGCEFIIDGGSIAGSAEELSEIPVSANP